MTRWPASPPWTPGPRSSSTTEIRRWSAGSTVDETPDLASSTRAAAPPFVTGWSAAQWSTSVDPSVDAGADLVHVVAGFAPEERRPLGRPDLPLEQSRNPDLGGAVGGDLNEQGELSRLPVPLRAD